MKRERLGRAFRVIVVNEFAGKQVAVLGLGRTGQSVVTSLLAGGASVVAWDDAEETRDAATEVGALIMDPAGWNWLGIDALVLSPGIPLTYPEPHEVVVRARHADVPVVGDIELFARAVNASDKDVKIVAVTGTNGKSTTASLIAHLLTRTGIEARLGGNIGVPVLDMEPPEDGAVYVLEVSSYQADLIESLRLDIVVFLNLTPDHLERHGDMAGYMKAKMRLVDRLTSGGKAIVGASSRPTQELCTQFTLSRKEALIAVSAEQVLGEGVFVVGGYLYDGTLPNAEKIADLNAITSLAGRHNWENAAAAYAVAHILGTERSRFQSAFESFEGLPHRTQVVAKLGKVLFVNDSKATNLEATSKALDAFNDVYWIAGGKGKEEDFARLQPLFPKIRRAYLIGEAAGEIATALAGEVDCVEAQTMERAIALAAKEAKISKAERPVVLLSPACASFDQYKSFEERGEVFSRLAQGLIEKQSNVVELPTNTVGGGEIV